MRYVLGVFFLALQLVIHVRNASAQTPKTVYIAPNAQTGLVSDIVYVPRYPELLTPYSSLVFRLDGAYISEISTIQTGGATVSRSEIIMSGGDPMHPRVVNSVKISGLRCDVTPFTHGVTPGTPVTLTLFNRNPNSGYESSAIDRWDLATFANPLDSHLKDGPAYAWSDGLWNVTATLRVSEAGAFSNAFETQSRPWV